MKPPFTLGVVGHFGLAVRNSKKSAQWFQRVLGLREEFEFEDGIAVGNENVTIVLFKGKPSPETLGHMSFHLPDMATLRKALDHLKKHDVDLEDPGDEIGPEAPRLAPYRSLVSRSRWLSLGVVSARRKVVHQLSTISDQPAKLHTARIDAIPQREVDGVRTSHGRTSQPSTLNL